MGIPFTVTMVFLFTITLVFLLTIGMVFLFTISSLHPTQYYKWSKAFLEAGKHRLNGDTIREAGSDEVKGLRDENEGLKMLVAELTLENRKLKKSSPDLE